MSGRSFITSSLIQRDGTVNIRDDQHLQNMKREEEGCTQLTCLPLRPNLSAEMYKHVTSICFTALVSSQLTATWGSHSSHKVKLPIQNLGPVSRPQSKRTTERTGSYFNVLTDAAPREAPLPVSQASALQLRAQHKAAINDDQHSRDSMTSSPSS